MQERVTAGRLRLQVTRHVALLSKWIAADLYAKEIDLLQFELSMSRCSNDLWSAVEAIEAREEAEGVLCAIATCARLRCQSSMPTPASVQSRALWSQVHALHTQESA
jgi:hypothetical protein